MAAILTIMAIGTYGVMCVFFLALIRAAGRADHVDESHHAMDLARTRQARRALVAGAGHRRHTASVH